MPQSYTVRINNEDVVRRFAGTTRICGMDIEVYTGNGKMPGWCGAPDPNSVPIVGAKSADREPSAPGAKAPHYFITDKGQSALDQYDGSKSNEMYYNMMRVMSVIAEGETRQINIATKLGIDQRKIWYIIGKLVKESLVKVIKGD